MRFTLLTALLLSSSLTFANETKVKELNWGINLEPSEYFEIAAKRFKKNVEIRTNNQIKVKLHIKEYSQDERDHLVDVQKNKYQMGQELVSYLIDKEDIFSVWELPFLFEDDQQVFAYMESPFAKDSLKALTKHGVTAVGYTYSGGFMFTVGNKIDHMNDLKDTKYYVEASTGKYMNLLRNKFKIKHVIDYDKSIIRKMRGSTEFLSSFLEELYEESKGLKLHLNLTRHRVFARTIFLNNDFLKTLTENEKKVILEEAKRAADFERNLSLEASNNHLDNIKNNWKDITINPWSLEKRLDHRKYFQKEYQAYEKKYGKGVIQDIINLKKRSLKKEYASNP